MSGDTPFGSSPRRELADGLVGVALNGETPVKPVWWESPSALGLALGLAVAMTWPLILHLPERLLGDPDVDVWNHAWGFWWVYHSLIERGELPLTTELLGYPRAGRLYFIDPVNALLSLPFQAMFGLPTAFNLVLIGALTLAGWSAWRLARSAGASFSGALLACLMVSVSPILRCEAHNGITEVLNAGWLGLSLWTVARAIERPGPASGAWAGLLGGLAFVACWYYGLAAGLAGLLLFLLGRPWRAPAAEDPSWRCPDADGLPATPPRLSAHAARHLRLWGSVGLALIVALAVILPFGLAFRWSLSGGDAIIHRNPDAARFLIRHNATDLLGFLHPGDYHRPDLWLEYRERFLHTTWLGFVSLGLGLVGLRTHRAGRRLTGAAWGALALVFAVLSLGPYLFVGGQFVTVGGQLIPLPFAAVFQGFGLAAITHPARLVLVTLYALAVLVALGWDRAVSSLAAEQVPPRRRGLLWSIVAAALVLEALGLAPGPLPVPHADARACESSQKLARDGLPGAVLDLPAQHLNTMRTSAFLYQQIFHRRPIPYIVHLRPESMPGMPEGALRRMLERLARAPLDLSHDGVSEPWQALREANRDALRESLEHTLIAGGYRAIVLHREIPAPPLGVRPFRVLFDDLLGAPESTSDGHWIYWLPPGESPSSSGDRP